MMRFKRILLNLVVFFLMLYFCVKGLLILFIVKVIMSYRNMRFYFVFIVVSIVSIVKIVFDVVSKWMERVLIWGVMKVL